MEASELLLVLLIGYLTGNTPRSGNLEPKINTKA